MLAVVALAISDACQCAVAVFNAFSPATAVGAGLSSIVKLNGIRREASSKSTVPLRLVGQAGVVISNGAVADAAGNRWNLPASVTIPVEGQIDVTGTAAVDGALNAETGTITTIATPTRGWQTVTNTAAATPGAPVESDAALRRRQANSSAGPATTPIESIYAAVSNVPGVTRATIYENDTDDTDANGIPSHSIAAVIEGGDADAIANAIAQKKTPGTGTFGTTSVVVHDERGVPATIRFLVLTRVALDIEVNITALDGYVTSTEDAIKAAIVAYVNAYDMGEDSYLGRLYVPANLSGGALSNTFNVTSIRQAREGDALAIADVAMAFNEAAFTDTDHITVNVA
jgi:uncharacterized phage protein gp47/JayE